MKRKSFLKLLGASLGSLPLARLAGSAEASAPAASAASVLDSSALPEGGWTLVVMPDTQNMALSFPEVLERETKWIVANRERYNIRFVIHEGDIVNNNTHPEWANARRAMDHLLRAKLPFSLLPGNHDLGRWGQSGTRDTMLSDYFTFWDYKIAEKYGLFEPTRLENSWHHLTTPGGKFLILSLEFGPRAAVLAWASKVVADNAERQVIVVTHAHLYADGTRYDWAKHGEKQRWNPKVYPIGKNGGDVNDAEEMWTKFVSKHANIRFVLSGHVLSNGTGYLVSEGEHGNRVHQILANYQSGVVPDRGFGGAGIVRLMHFSADNRTVAVRTFSTWHERFITEPEHEFSVTV